MQDPNDRQNLIFEGREVLFLENLHALLGDASSDLHSVVEQQINHHAASDAALITRTAEAARQELVTIW